MMNYKLNEEWPSYPNADVNGVAFDAETVVSGDQWEKFSKPVFKGKPPILVKTNDVMTKGTAAKNKGTEKQKENPGTGTTSSLFSTAMKLDSERAEAEAKAEAEAEAQKPEDESEDNEPNGEPEQELASEPEPEETAQEENSGMTEVKPVQAGYAPEPPVQVLKPEHERRAEETQKQEDNGQLELIDIRGIGEGRVDQLQNAGYNSVADVASADPKKILADLKAQGSRMNLSTAKSVVKNAKELLES